MAAAFFSLLFPIISVLFGVAALCTVRIRWFYPEFIAASTTVGLLLSSWILLIAVILFGYTAGGWIWAAVVGIGIAYSIPTLRRGQLLLHPKESFSFTNIAWIGVTAITTIVLGWLLVSHMLFLKDGDYVSAGGAWGDLGLHMSLISRFAQQTQFTWDLPVYSGAKLTYPFLIDFTSGSLMRWGATPQLALIAPSALLMASFIQLFFFFSYRIFKNSWAAALGIFLFLASGSPAGVIYFWRDWQASGMGLFTFLGNMTKEYAHLADYGLFFSNVVADLLLPQRGILFGLAIFMFVSLLWWKSHSAEGTHQRDLLLASAVAVGLLPFAHVHTAFVLVGIFVWFAAWHSWQQKTLLNNWMLAMVLMLALAGPQIAWQMLGNYTDTFSYWRIGWKTGVRESVLQFWVRNMGLGIVLLFTNIGLIMFMKRRSFHILYYVPLVALFIICNVYIFQPHDYDNLKFIVFSYLGLSVYTGYLLATWFKKNTVLAISAGIILISLTLSGMLSILRESYTMWPFNSAHDISIAKTVQALIPPEARVLTSDQHNHFITTLVGRRIVMGYRGWLWTYGIDYRKTERDVQAMYTGAPNTPNLFKQYDVSFVVIGPSEMDQFSPNVEYFEQNAKRVLQASGYTIYDVRALARQ